MGLKSFWSSLTTSSRVKEIPIKPQAQAPVVNRQRSATTTSTKISRVNQSRNSRFADDAWSPTSSPQDNNSKRRSRGFSLSRNKSETDLSLKKRRSWFGGKPSEEEDIPAVPALPVARHERSRHLNTVDKEAPRPGTALTTNDPISWSRSQSPASEDERTGRLEALKAASDRKQGVSGGIQGLTRKRQSSHGAKVAQNRTLPNTRTPASPPAPAKLTDPQSGVAPPDEKRKSRRKSLVQRFSLHRSKSATDLNATKQWSWMGDESVSIPPVPQLVYDGSITPDSSVPTASSPDNIETAQEPAYMKRLTHKSFYDDPMHTVTRGESIKQPRPLSMPARRQSYVPKSAATGFLKSVSGNSLTANAQGRKTMLDEPSRGLNGVGDEQQLEWDKLKHLLEEMEKQQNNGVIGMLRELEDDEEDDERQTYANARALAALEFGVDAR